MQNCNFHECDSIITRVGTDSRIIFAGDYYQSDFDHVRDKTGIIQFLKIIDRLKYFKHVQFNWEDCVRSGLVRDYLMTKEMIAKEEKAP
jgi:phosphate starvation-inducible protein PhoH